MASLQFIRSITFIPFITFIKKAIHPSRLPRIAPSRNHAETTGALRTLSGHTGQPTIALTSVLRDRCIPQAPRMMMRYDYPSLCLLTSPNVASRLKETFAKSHSTKRLGRKSITIL